MSIQEKKKMIFYRCWHRGCKETDILLGDFAQKFLENMTKEEVNELEIVTKIDDYELYQYLTKKKKIPNNLPRNILYKIADYNINKNKKGFH